MFHGTLLFRNLDIRGSRILPRLNKLRADGDTGIAKEIEDSWETGLFWGRSDAVEQNRRKVITMVNRCAMISNALQRFFTNKTVLLLLH